MNIGAGRTLFSLWGGEREVFKMYRGEVGDLRAIIGGTRRELVLGRTLRKTGHSLRMVTEAQWKACM